MGVSDSETQIIQTGPGEAGGRPQRAVGASSRPRVTAAPRTPGGRSLTALSPAAGGSRRRPSWCWANVFINNARNGVRGRGCRGLYSRLNSSANLALRKKARIDFFKENGTHEARRKRLSLRPGLAAAPAAPSCPRGTPGGTRLPRPRPPGPARRWRRVTLTEVQAPGTPEASCLRPATEPSRQRRQDPRHPVCR